ncbi:MAG: hypothetical protein M3O32_00290 [Actinomycetota bacterium]|nr:hypothetical protein [Actinomycetota bacterium]
MTISSRSRASQSWRTAPSCSSTTAEAFMLTYQLGCVGAPPMEATAM